MRHHPRGTLGYLVAAQTDENFYKFLTLPPRLELLCATNFRIAENVRIDRIDQHEAVTENSPGLENRFIQHFPKNNF
jgi:hypothetical protein